MANETGPFIQAATFCERVITEGDGAVTAVRIIDRITFAADADGQPHNPVHPVWILLALKSGTARGRLNLEIRCEQPSGQSASVLKTALFFEGEDRGSNLVVPGMPFQPEQEGLYWFDVYLDEKRITRMPLRAVFQPMPTTGTPSS